MSDIELDLLGRGGFGIVHKIRRADETFAARKTFSPAFYVIPADREKLRKRFKREVLIQHELGGKEILPIIDYKLDVESPWFVMPLAEKTYDMQIQDDRAGGRVDIDAIADILNALDYLHKLGFVHRDLNPKNILKHEGSWKLSDLGAVLPPSGATVTLTDGTVIYTEQYCSPEQRNDFHKARPPSDIYAFGCILHDIYGKTPRIPYAKQTAEGHIGLIIEKCTETNPDRRPTVSVLRTLVIEALIEAGGHCKVVDAKAEEWLGRIEHVAEWGADDYGNFARYFVSLDIEERAPGHEHDWVYSLSTPFLTRIPEAALVAICKKNDEIADAVVEKYCIWASETNFLFSYADVICGKLVAIYDNGSAPHKAMAFVALVRLAVSHNRWYVMREMLERCSLPMTGEDIARRLRVELVAEELVDEFTVCVESVNWDKKRLATEITKILTEGQSST